MFQGKCRVHWYFRTRRLSEYNPKPSLLDDLIPWWHVNAMMYFSGRYAVLKPCTLLCHLQWRSLPHGNPIIRPVVRHKASGSHLRKHRRVARKAGFVWTRVDEQNRSEQQLTLNSASHRSRPVVIEFMSCIVKGWIVLLNCPGAYLSDKTYFYICHHFSTLRWGRYLESTILENKGLLANKGNTMAVDDLATLGAWTSPAMVLTWFPGDIVTIVVTRWAAYCW